MTIIGVLVSGEISRLRGHEDPSEIVIDEVAGQLLAYFLVPVSVVNLTAGFFLFRLFDIWKPFPARQAEDLKHGVGIMADDLIAGLYANIVLQFMSRLLPQ